MSATPAHKRDIQWADGLRGIACVFVIVAHGFQGFGMPTRTSSFDVPFPFALPFFRILLHGGFLAVAIFFIMSGYVCSMRPLKLARAGKPDEARKSIASSAFRRVIRLALPSTLATTISWFITQVNGYKMAYTLDSWLNMHSAWPSQTWWEAIKSLLRALAHTWTYDGEVFSTGRNYYEMIQWTLAVELRASMFVYITLVITAAFTPFYRCTVFTILLMYSVYLGDLMGEIPFYFGVLMAELSLYLSKESVSTSPPLFTGRFTKHWPIVMTVFALIFSSYPTNHAELAAWSRFMTRLGTAIFHPRWEQRWVWATLGGMFLIFAIHFSPALRRIFSYRYAVFLGSISFPLYLLHSFTMRTLLVWIVYGLIPQDLGLLTYINDAIGMSLWMALLIRLSMFWRDRIDSSFGVFSVWFEEVMMGKKSMLEPIWTVQEKVQYFSRRTRLVDSDLKESKV